MNLAELKALVSYWIDDINMTYFTPTQLTRFLNNAQREVQKLVLGAGQDYYVKCATTACVVNQQEYILPEDFYKLNRFVCITSGSGPNAAINPIMMITPNQQDLICYTQGVPQVYWFKKNRLVLLPYPDQTYTLQLNYSYRVVDMVNDTDIPDIPLEYHEFIGILAAWDCLLKDGRDANVLKEKKDYYLTMLKADAAQRSVDQSRTVVYTGSYDDMGSGWY